MLTEREVISTLDMLRSEHLDVRTVTLGLNLFDCASDNFDTFAYRVRSKLIAMLRTSLPSATKSATAMVFPLLINVLRSLRSEPSVPDTAAIRWSKSANF